MSTPRVWPVIHFDTPASAYRNAAIAARCDCTGVFLIHMDGLDDQLDPVAVEIKRRHPHLKVGINYLSLPAPVALVRSLGLGLDATWTDSPGVRSDAILPMTEAIAPVLKANPAHLFFGSVAFKYQPEDMDPPEAARRAIALGMIPTTSGLATGSAPNPEKLFRIRQGIGAGAPLALASGVTPDNAYELGRFLTHVLVSTGISESFYVFSEVLLDRLMVQIQGDAAANFGTDAGAGLR